MAEGQARREGPWGAFRPGPAARFWIWLSRNTLLGRGGGRKWVFRRFKSVHEGPVDVELWGTRVRLHPDRNVSEGKALLRPDKMDPAEHALMRDAMARPGAVLVDVGGNAGLYSLDAALNGGPGARIVMIEPSEDLISRFTFNLAEARAAGRVREDVRVDIEACAISDHAGEGILSLEGAEGSRALVGASGGAGLKVPLKPLAGLVTGLGLSHIDAMKIDVEGHEDKVLPPFFAAAPAALWPGLIIIEHLQRETWGTDCIAGALALGYRIILKTRNNTVLSRT